MEKIQTEHLQSNVIQQIGDIILVVVNDHLLSNQILISKMRKLETNKKIIVLHNCMNIRNMIEMRERIVN